jgi:cell division protein ZapD
MNESDKTDSQFGLFETIQDKAVYELPINERIRNFLRLEFLFGLAEHSRDITSEWASRHCIISLIDICDLLSRTDIKGELTKELDKQITRFESFQKNPEVESEVLTDILNQLRDTHQQLVNPNYHPGNSIRNDELLNAIKQRVSIAGGTCNFDMPSFHFWLSKSASERKFQLGRWMDDIKYIKQAIDLILNILRTSSEMTEETAAEGFFQYSMDPNKAAQLVRIVLPIGEFYFPEISGGRHRFSIRFLEQSNTEERPSQIKRTLNFKLQCCY